MYSLCLIFICPLFLFSLSLSLSLLPWFLSPSFFLLLQSSRETHISSWEKIKTVYYNLFKKEPLWLLLLLLILTDWLSVCLSLRIFAMWVYVCVYPVHLNCCTCCSLFYNCQWVASLVDTVDNGHLCSCSCADERSHKVQPSGHRSLCSQFWMLSSLSLSFSSFLPA